ncbi:Pentatricopeptide repeat [Macleaya cordata]|uniref:Pentatricopeptide repeat n=1 Tax=Macleaya cordata TaxID=56857 RepID=A0A200R242_MACCD|nr:Pentatricopeptide repeat [Macleaya cordata]
MLRNPNQFLLLWRTNNGGRWFCTERGSSWRPPTRKWNRSPSPSYNGSKELSTLYHKLTALGKSNGSVVPVLNDWNLNLRKPLTRSDIVDFVDELRKYKQFNIALQLLEWMEMRGMHLSYSDHAKRIDLLWKTGGVVAAEKYFTEIPRPAKNKATYGALLNCFCNEKMKEKATELLEQMKRRNFASSYHAYNSLMTLHMKLGEAEKVPALEEEMKKKNIPLNLFTYNLLMSSYASLKDTEGVERVLNEVERASAVRPDWTLYCNVASVYVGAGLFEKADLVLKKIERRKMLCDRKAFHFLLTLYASMGNAVEVNRIWESLKSSFPKTPNMSYLTMLQTLSRLNDLDGLKKCFDEWEKVRESNDIRLVNAVITAYLKHDMIGEATSLLERALQNGFKPSFSTYVLFVEFYVKNRSMDLALKSMEIAITPNLKENEMRMYFDKVLMFLKYFEDEKDVDGAEEFCNILKKANCLNQEVYNFLLRIYMAAGRAEPQMRQRMKLDAIEISSETEKMLEFVCPD